MRKIEDDSLNMIRKNQFNRVAPPNNLVICLRNTTT